MIINFLALAAFAYLMLWPVAFPIIYNEPFPVSHSEIKKGETLSYVIDFYKFKDYVSEIHQNIICEDGNLMTLVPVNTNYPVGRHTITSSVVIPEKASYSKCYLELSVTYHINPLRSENRTMRTESFTIVE